MTSEHKNPKNQRAEKPTNSKQRKSPAKKKQNFKSKKNSLRTSSTINFSEILAPLAAKHSILSAKSKEDAFELIGTETKSPLRPTAQGGAIELKATESSSEKPGDQVFQQALGLLKGVLFKRDMPYRTSLPLSGNFNTSAAGVLNVTESVSSVGSTAEWGSIDALFDEVFVHAMHFTYIPYNDLGGGVGFSASAAITGGITTVADTIITNCPIVMVSLFHGSPVYTTGAAMLANPSSKVTTTAKRFKYSWRNNERFDPRGTGTGTGGNWQGWIQISNVSGLGGQIQFLPIVSGATIGTGSAAVSLGAFVCKFDCSFRARS